MKVVGSAAAQPAAGRGDALTEGVAARAAAEPSGTANEPEEDAAIASPPTLEDGPPSVLDEAAEAAFLADAKERGEVVPRKSAADIEEEASPKALPPLDELVNKIPADVREVLDDLFRARFVTVKRFPKKSLKSM